MMTDEVIADLIQTLLPTGGTVLDVGCGGGHTLAVLADRSMSGVGVDPYPHGGEVPCWRLRAEEIGTLEERFDLIYTVYSLHHFDAPRQFLREAKRILRPTGVLLIVDWVKGAKTSVQEHYFATETIARWMATVGFDLVRQEVREQTMVIIGRHATPQKIG
jgi:SAM-dependent methyltransferase